MLLEENFVEEFRAWINERQKSPSLSLMMKITTLLKGKKGLRSILKLKQNTRDPEISSINCFKIYIYLNGMYFPQLTKKQIEAIVEELKRYDVKKQFLLESIETILCKVSARLGIDVAVRNAHKY